MKTLKVLLLFQYVIMSNYSFSLTNDNNNTIGNGKIITKIINATNIFQIKNTITFNIIVKDDCINDEIIIETDENIMDYIKYVIEHSKIVFSFESNSEVSKIQPTKANLYINSNQIMLFENEGVGDIIINKIKSFDKLTIINSGVGDIRFLNIDGDSLILQISGVGNVKLGGKLNFLKIFHQGVGKVNAKDAIVNKAWVGNNGNGNVLINVVKELSIECKGFGFVKYKGNPTILSSEVGKYGIIKK